jgi:hypothetical protein
MLVSRTLLFAGWQVIIAAFIAILGGASPWEKAAAWWPATATLTNAVCIALLVVLFRREGKRFWDIFRFESTTWKHDLPLVVGFVVLSSALVLLPNLGLAVWLFGDAQVTAELLFRPLPVWSVWLFMIAFPLSMALAELPTYFAYAMPRLGRGLWPALVAGFFLGIQHFTLPLLFDWRFMIWRAAMFLPFALLIALVLRWRPRLLPYMVVAHGLLDLQAVLMLFPASY